MTNEENTKVMEILKVENHTELSKEFPCRVIQYKISECDIVTYNHHIFFYKLDRAVEFYNILKKSGFDTSISSYCVFAKSDNKQDIFQISGI